MVVANFEIKKRISLSTCHNCKWLHHDTVVNIWRPPAMQECILPETHYTALLW